MGIVLGIDGGGTKTVAAVAHDDGRLLGVAVCGPSNLQNEGVDRVAEVYRQVVSQALQQAGLALSDVELIVAGAGGLDTDHDRNRFAGILAGLSDRPVPYLLHNDSVIALAAGTLGDPGVGVVAGTGSIVVGVDPMGRQCYMGGWGYLFGDEGSAFDVGRRAVRAVLRQQERRGPETLLARMLGDALALSSPESLLPFFYDLRAGVVTVLAGLATTVSRAAEVGDAVAQQILREAAAELGDVTAAMVERLRQAGWNSGPIPVVPSGGLFSSGVYARCFADQVACRAPGCSLVSPQLPPVGGALVLGIRQLAGAASASCVARLKQALPRALGSGKEEIPHAI